MAVEFDFVSGIDLRIPEGDPPVIGRRKAFRAIPPGVRVRLLDTLDSFRVNDISAGGVCLEAPKGRFQEDDELRLDVLLADKVYLHDVGARVLRVFSDECACCFVELSRNQGLKLDKLVLEMQKRFIIQRKLEREAEENLQPDTPSEDDSSPTVPTINLNMPL